MTRRLAVVLLAPALLLAGCQTTGDQPQSGAVAGGLVGAASGAGAATGVAIAGGGFSGQNMLVGVLAGIVAGAIAGHYAAGGKTRETASAEDLAAADAASQLIANDPDGKLVHWGSDDKSTVFGWAELLPERADEGGTGCKTVKSVQFANGLENYEIRYFCPKDGKWVERPPT